jgi:TrkA domain protein
MRPSSVLRSAVVDALRTIFITLDLPNCRMTVYETELPGVGHKFELELDGDERVVVLIHHDGRREVYLRPGKDQDSRKLFGLTGKQARQLGSILEGAHFQPVEMDEVQVPLGEGIIEWVEVDSSSPLVGRTLRDANVRGQTGASVIAIQRGEETLSNPTPETTVEAADILVTLGSRTEQRALSELVEGDDGDDTEP